MYKQQTLIISLNFTTIINLFFKSDWLITMLFQGQQRWWPRNMSHLVKSGSAWWPFKVNSFKRFWGTSILHFLKRLLHLRPKRFACHPQNLNFVNDWCILPIYFCNPNNLFQSHSQNGQFLDKMHCIAYYFCTKSLFDSEFCAEKKFWLYISSCSMQPCLALKYCMLCHFLFLSPNKTYLPKRGIYNHDTLCQAEASCPFKVRARAPSDFETSGFWIQLPKDKKLQINIFYISYNHTSMIESFSASIISC